MNAQMNTSNDYIILENGAWQKVEARCGNFVKVMSFGNPYPMYYRQNNNKWQLIQHMFKWEYRGK